MSASFLLSPWAATLTAPECCAVDPHCAQNGLFEAAGGGGGGGGGIIEFPDPPHEASSKTSVAITQTPIHRNTEVALAKLIHYSWKNEALEKRHIDDV
jgi:hypothetical protein